MNKKIYGFNLTNLGIYAIYKLINNNENDINKLFYQIQNLFFF